MVVAVDGTKRGEAVAAAGGDDGERKRKEGEMATNGCRDWSDTWKVIEFYDYPLKTLNDTKKVL